MSLSRKMQRSLDRAMKKPLIAAAFEAQRRSFIAKFGREPTGSDPVFFDPDADTLKPIDPTQFTSDMVSGMRDAGIPERLIYAFERTGMIVSQFNEDQFSKADLAEYDQAIKEYDDGMRSRSGAPVP